MRFVCAPTNNTTTNRKSDKQNNRPKQTNKQTNKTLSVCDYLPGGRRIEAAIKQELRIVDNKQPMQATQQHVATNSVRIDYIRYSFLDT
jgi:hypothetical protein